MSQPKTTPIILPEQKITSQPAESFPTPSNGHVTWRTLLSTPQTPSSDMCAGLATCPPRTGFLACHRHTQAEIYYITSGSGVVVIDGSEYVVSKGAVVFIPGDAEHGVRNEGGEPLVWFYVFPTAGFGDVVYRFSHEDKKAKL
ncbi:cupin domain-containing protein [Aspergillus puulaauensis]|uniref:Cupin type-2 domain-containing protein n=1 Tax=Aspergillus puulaauensis TaxID=1220207 RepID=A0A7R7Y0C3_9EURO|nr:uncharacterized protein APUU_80137S [Aspergillus puulaauensis]BCS29834.1 hypothetical protein APUU_80137S [Aspergillus puulaauensis]